MKFLSFIAAAVFIVYGNVACGDPLSRFDEGLRLYREGDIASSIEVWEKLADEGTVSGPLYFNLGNAYYRSGQVGKSILYYERARTLLPRDEDVVSNLDLARLAVADKIDAPVKLVIWKWIDGVRDYVTLRELAWLLYGLGILAAGSMAVWMVSAGSLRRFFKPVMTVLLSLFIAAALWYSWRAALDARTWAIVMPERSVVYSGPDESSAELFVLHEGTKVQTGETLGEWIRARLADGRQGWMRLPDIEEI